MPRALFFHCPLLLFLLLKPTLDIATPQPGIYFCAWIRGNSSVSVNKS